MMDALSLSNIEKIGLKIMAAILWIYESWSLLWPIYIIVITIIIARITIAIIYNSDRHRPGE